MTDKLLTRDLSPEFEFIELYPLNDVHLGDVLHKEKEFRAFLSFVLDKPYRYLMCIGDLVNNGIEGSATGAYGEKVRVGDQPYEMVELLRPVADRILAMTGGNHEHRTKKATDQDLTRLIASLLGLQDYYKRDMINLKLTFGRKPNGKRQCYVIHAAHGGGGGVSAGGALNKAVAASDNTIADLYIFGHVHKRIGTKHITFVPDTKNNLLLPVEKAIAVASGWLGYGGYIARAQLRPQVTGSAPITLWAREKRADVLI